MPVVCLWVPGYLPWFKGLLSDSWVAISGVISGVTITITPIKGLEPPLITTHKPYITVKGTPYPPLIATHEPPSTPYKVYYRLLRALASDSRHGLGFRVLGF